MKSIFMVSPNYLEISYNEALKYEFTLQGYGSCENGSKGLLKINVTDVLGYVYFAQRLPADLSSLEEFIYRCNLMGGNRKFIFALLDTSRINQLNLKSYHNLRFGLINIEEIVTDTVINRDIFGSLLLDNYTPYSIEGIDNTIPENQYVYRLRYKPLFSSYILDCLRKVNRAESFEQTLMNDEIYLKYCKDNSILAKFREYYIKTYYQANLDNSHLQQLIQDNLDNINYGVYSALLALISPINN